MKTATYEGAREADAVEPTNLAEQGELEIEPGWVEREAGKRASLVGDDVFNFVKARGPGRPKGSKNKKTSEIMRLIDRKFRDPLFAMAEITEIGPVGLAKLLGCKPVEAMSHWLTVVKDYMRYKHVPLQASDADAGRLSLTINLDGPLAHPEAGSTVIDAFEGSELVEFEQVDSE